MICVQCATGGGAAIFAAVFAAVAAIQGLEWVLARIWWIAGSAAVITALAVAAVIPLMRWAERRDARRLPLWKVREVPASVTATVIPQAVTGARPAIENHFHVHHHYADGREPVRVFTAIPGQAGDALTEGE